MFSYNTSFAEQQLSETEIIPINSSIGLEKTTLYFHVPHDNQLPWAYVEGKISYPVPDYPVIIQIFDSDDYEPFDEEIEKDEQIEGEEYGAIQFAQVNVNEDDTYEFKFRVRDVNDGEVIEKYEGGYYAIIFKVVYLNPNLTSI